MWWCNHSMRLLLLLIATLHSFRRCSYSFVLPSSTSCIHSSSRGVQSRSNNHGYARVTQHAATIAAAEIDTETISVALPLNWRDSSDNNWSIQAADILTRHGVVALTSSSSSSNNNGKYEGLISSQIIEKANKSASSRLNDMQARISNRGVDPNGIEDGPYRFAEIICRDEGGLRYDVPLPWLGGGGNNNDGDSNATNNDQVGSGRIGAPLTSMESEGVKGLHEAMDEIVPHVLEALWLSDEDNASDDITNNNRSSYVAASGYLINKPGSKSQNWHKDGPDAGFIDCFVPLIDLNEELGPTAFLLGEKEEEENELVPMLNKGNILLFDYRTIHRGQGNTSEDTTRTLAYAVYRRRERDGDGMKKENGGDVHNFPAALTLEYD